MKQKKALQWMLTLLILTSALLLAGCGSSNNAAEIDENAEPFIGTWQADTVTLTVAPDETPHDISAVVSVTLDADMTGELTINDSTQKITWEVYSSETAEDRALITLKDSFDLAGLELDPEQLFLGAKSYGEEETHLYWDWSSTTEHGVKISWESLMKKVK